MVRWLLNGALLGVVNLCLVFCTASSSLAEEGASGKTLILYYSLTGNTRAGCEVLQAELGADIIEISSVPTLIKQ